MKVTEKKNRVITTTKDKKLSIGLKLDVLRKLQNGMKVMEVAPSLNLSDGTVRSIRINRLKIEECGNSISSGISEVLSCGLIF